MKGTLIPSKLANQVTQKTLNALLFDFENDLKIKPTYEDDNIIDHYVHIPIYRGETLFQKNKILKDADWTYNPLRALYYSLHYSKPCVLMHHVIARPQYLNKRFLVNRREKPFNDARNDLTHHQLKWSNYKIITIQRKNDV